MDPADTKELPREMSAADVAEETKADVEAVKSVEDATLRSRPTGPGSPAARPTCV